MKIRILTALGMLAVTGMANSAELCSAPGAHPDGLDVSDVTWTYDGSTQNASDCYGVVNGNVNNAGDIDAAFGPTWQALASTDPTRSVNNLFEDVTFTFSCLTGCGPASTSGTYQLVWEGLASAFPLTFDFTVALKGSDRYALYLFEALTINADPASGDGTWEITYENNGGQLPNISHLDVFVRASDSPPPPPPPPPPVIVAEPGTLALLGLGLLGIGLGQNRRRKRLG